MGCFKNIVEKINELVAQGEVVITTLDENSIKNTRYEVTAITDEVLDDIVNTSEGFKALEDILQYKSVKDKVQAAATIHRDSHLSSILGKGINPRYRTIAIKHLISSAKSEQDLTDKYNLKDSEKDLVKHDDVNTYGTSYSNLAYIIGRDIINSHLGTSIISTTEDSDLDVVNFYTTIGEQALEGISDLYSIKQDGYIVNRRFKRDDNTEAMYSTGKVIGGVKTIAFNKEALYPNRANKSDIIATNSRLAAMYNLLSPSNIDIPTSDPKVIREGFQELELHPASKDRLEFFQEHPLRMSDWSKEFFEELKSMVDKDTNKTKNTLASIVSIVNNSSTSEKMFGTIDQNELAALSMDRPAREQEYGRSLSKVIQFERILDDYDNLLEDLFYSYQTPKQNRMHVIEQTLNTQTDNFLSRHIMETPYEQELSDPEDIYYMMAYISDETGLSAKEIAGIDSNPELEKALKALDNDKLSSFETIIYLDSLISNPKNPLSNKFNSVWKFRYYLQGIHDIRNIKNGVVTTKIMPKPDASGSGTVITVLQSIGRNEAAKEVAEQLLSGGLTDVYKLAMDPVLEELTSLKDLDETQIWKKSNLEGLNQLADVIKALYAHDIKTEVGLKDASKQIRELIKYPFTRFIYGQNEKNNTLEMSKELAALILETNDMNVMHSLLGNKFSPENTMETNRELLVNYFNSPKGFAKHLVSIISREVDDKLFKEQSEQLASIHKLLQEARYADNEYSDIRIVPPLAALDIQDNGGGVSYTAARNKYSTSIEKAMEVVISDKDGNFTVVKRNHPNEISIKVLLQHMVDAAIAYRAITRNKDNEYNGLMLNHDSIGTNVSSARALEPDYIAETLEVNSRYDFVEAALSELKYAKSKISDPKLEARMETLISELEPKVKESKKIKQDMLDKADLEKAAPLFGIKQSAREEARGIDLDNIKPIEAVKPTTKKPKAKKEPAKPQAINQREFIQELKEKLSKKNYDRVRLAIINKALKINPNVKLQFGEKNQYNLATNTITFTPRVSSEQVAHEFIHAAVAQAIENNPVTRKRFQSLFDEYIDHRNKNISYKDVTRGEAQLWKPDYGLHEFVAMGLSNLQLRDELSKIQPKNKSNLLSRFTRFILQTLGLPVKSSLYTDLLEEFSNTSYNPSAKSEGTFNFTDAVKDQYKEYLPSNKDSKTAFEDLGEQFDKLDEAAADMLDKFIDLSLDTAANKLGGRKLHVTLKKRSEIYKDTFRAIHNLWHKNSFVGKMRWYLDLDEVSFKDSINKMETQAMNAEANKTAFEDKTISKLEKMMRGKFSNEQKETLYQVFVEAPIFHLNKEGYLQAIAEGKSIDEVIVSLKKEYKVTKAMEDKASNLANLYINKETTRGMRHTDIGDLYAVKALSALYSLKLIPNSEQEIRNMYNNHRDIMQEFLDLSSGNKALDDSLHKDTRYSQGVHVGNLELPTFKENVQLKQVTKSSINSLFDESKGWKILRKPTTNTTGIIYRIQEEVTFQAGLGTNYKMDPTENLIVYNKNQDAENANAVSVVDSNAEKLILSKEELTELGEERDVAKSLVKSYSHRMMLLETQSIRKELVDKFTYQYTPDLDSQIRKDIKTREHLIYMKLPKDISIDNLPKDIRLRYKPVSYTSDVDNFDEQVTLVRKDLSDFVQGYKEIQIGEEGTTINKLYHLLRKSIILQKIHWVITNPVKTLMDITSNNAFLLSRNVPITSIYKYSKEAMNHMHSLTTLRHKLILAELEYRAKGHKESKKKKEKLEREIQNHPLASAHYNGFIQSISVDIKGRTETQSSGIQKDIESLLNKVVQNDKGHSNRIGKAIIKVSKWGVNAEDLMVGLANKIYDKNGESSNMGASIAESLEEMAEHLEKIKKKEDAAAYITEYMGTPGSMMVSVGSMVTQMADFTARWTYYKHLKSKGENEADAVREALRSFIDYKVNLPRELKIMENIGVISFISFTARIQRIIISLFRSNPLNASITLLLNELIGSSGVTIIDANLLDRIAEGRFIKTPTPDLSMLFATKLF